MARVLTAARVQVPPDEETKYTRLIAEQAREFGEHGLRLWVFRSREEAGVFLEFREGAGPTPKWHGEDLDTIHQRDTGLHLIASYVGEETVWDEVRLDDGRAS